MDLDKDHKEIDLTYKQNPVEQDQQNLSVETYKHPYQLNREETHY